MSLAILTILTILTSPWFILVAFEKIIPAAFYIPTITELFRNFFSYFSFDFLFFIGDPVLKNSIPEIGLFHLWELPFFLIGFYLIFSDIKKKWLAVIFLVVTLFFASLSNPSPNLFWSLPYFFISSLIVALGLKFFFKRFLKK